MYRTHLGSRGLPRNDLLCMTHDALSTGTQHLDQPSQGVANTSPIANRRDKDLPHTPRSAAAKLSYRRSTGF